jgi:hypothetical protein
MKATTANTHKADFEYQSERTQEKKASMKLRALKRGKHSRWNEGE